MCALEINSVNKSHLWENTKMLDKKYEKLVKGI